MSDDAPDPKSVNAWVDALTPEELAALKEKLKADVFEGESQWTIQS